MPGHAQTKQIAFSHLSTDAGLSQSNVTCVLQDQQGFMWFGTRDGLNRYDGYHFQVYKNQPGNPNSLSNNFITDILSDHAGHLWIATFGGGLDRFDIRTHRFRRLEHQKNRPGSLSDNFVNKLYRDPQGRIWVCTDGGGLDLLDPVQGTFLHYLHREGDPQSLIDDDVSSILEDHKGRIWVGTYGGLDLLQPNSRGDFLAFTHQQGDNSSLSSSAVLCLYEDAGDRIWVGTRGGGLDLMNGDQGSFQHFMNDPGRPHSLSSNVVLSLGSGDHGRLWVGTENGGLCLWRAGTRSFDNYHQDDIDPGSLSNNSIYAIYRDDEQNIWVATYSGGVNLYNPNANQFAWFRHSTFPQSLSNNNVLCFFEDDHKQIWIGTDGGGLDLMDRSKGSFRSLHSDPMNPNSLSGNYILDICQDQDQHIWVGTWEAGITVLGPGNRIIRKYRYRSGDTSGLGSNNIYCLKSDQDHHIWIGTFGAGLDCFDETTGTFRHYRSNPSDPYSLSSDRVNSILPDTGGLIWVGTFDGGLNLLDERTGRFRHFLHKEGTNSLSGNSVSSLLADQQGGIWIATTNGLDYLNPQRDHFTVYTTENGLPNNAVMGILQGPGGHIWVSTDDGFCRLDPRTGQCRVFSRADGLQSREFKAHSCLETKGGEMFFGGIRGFNAFYPDSIRKISFDPPLVFTSFKILDQEVPIAVTAKPGSPLHQDIAYTRSLSIPYRSSELSFRFASLNYSPADRKQYAYRLLGFDHNWNLIGTSRSLTYTNLDPGHYRLEVRGLNNDGSWSSRMATLELTITPPFYLSWWFKVLVLVGVVSVLLGLFRARERRNIRQKRQLERKVRERTQRLAALTDQERKAREEAEMASQEAEKANLAKSVFLATMSHEIRTPMNGVIGMATLLVQTPMNTEQRDYAETIRQCGESLLNVIDDILDFSKIESGKMELESHDFDLRACIEEVLDIFSRKASLQGLDLVYQMENNVPRQIIGDPHRLRQILTNLVSNAIKFTKQGEVYIGVRLEEVGDQYIRLAFEVRDTGIGIPEAKKDRLFKPFSQVDSSTTRQYGGSGLGLAICTKLVDLMGGQIRVESQEGKGTSFHFSIRAVAGTQSLRTYVHLNPGHFEGNRVLVVDDNPTNLNILKVQLETWNFIPITARSGEEALHLLDHPMKFDLVLTDMRMPEMDGRELSLLIKKRLPTLPIILLSSLGEEYPERNRDLFKAVLSKPIKQDILYKEILNVLLEKTNKDRIPASGKTILSPQFAEDHPLRILVAEDNPVNQKVASHTLGKLGYIPEVVENGQAVLDSLGQQSWDLILMDIQMPVLDGLEATRIIRGLDINQPFIIAMTATATLEQRERCLEAGMDDYLSKPVRLEELLKLLTKWAMLRSKKISSGA